MTTEERLLRARYVFGFATSVFLVMVVASFYFLSVQHRAIKQESYDVSGIASMQLRIHFESLLGKLTAIDAGTPEADANAAVLQYDILYERLTALPRRPSYVALLDDDLLETLGEITRALHREQPLIDRAADGDISALIGMRARIEPWRLAIERVAHRPVQIASEQRDAARRRLVDISYGLFVVVASFVTAGTMFATVIWRQMGAAERRERALKSSRDELRQNFQSLERLRARSDQQAADAMRMSEELTRARERLHDALESISEGFAFWDSDDRLVMCNERYRSFYSEVQAILTPGASFVDFITAAHDAGLFVPSSGDRDAEIALRIDRHRTGEQSFEQQLRGGRWIRINKRKTMSGHVVATVSDITFEVRSKETIMRLAHEDPLTGVPNRSEFQRRLREALALAERIDRRVGIMMLDLDRFKAVNDTLGHSAGDALLRKVAARIRQCLRETDTVARLGGDEFGVIVTNAQDLDCINAAARRIVDALSEPVRIDGREIHPGASIGITIFPDDRGDEGQLLRHADLALYRAKEDGRGACRMYDEQMQQTVEARVALESDLGKAIQTGALEVHYQPQVAVASGAIVGAEALIRWRHPERGLVSPAEFIPIAEKSRQIVEIGEWVLRDVARQFADWRARGLAMPRVAVNISPVQLRQPDFVAGVKAALEDAGLPPRLLELEITEGVAMEMGHETREVFDALKALGVGLAIDDFGAGYSSLGRLKDLPVDCLKIDRGFTRNILADSCDAEICSAVTRLAQALDLKVVAEGVETLEQLRVLRAQNCDVAQGFYFSPALPADAFEEYVRGFAPEALWGPDDPLEREQPAA